MKYRKEILSIIKPNTILFIKYWQDWKMSNHSASIKWKNKACGEFSIWSDEAKPVLNSVLVFKQRNKAKKILIFINPSKILLIQYWLQSQYLHRKAWKCQTTQLLTLSRNVMVWTLWLWLEKDFDQSLGVLHLSLYCANNAFSFVARDGLVLSQASSWMDVLFASYIQEFLATQTHFIIRCHCRHKICLHILFEKSPGFWWWIYVLVHWLEYFYLKVRPHFKSMQNL